jgi:hypothetical protein
MNKQQKEQNMNFRNALLQLLNPPTNPEEAELPLLNEDGGVLVSIDVARALFSAGLINQDASMCYEARHPIKTTQVFDEATAVELIDTNCPLGHVVKFAVGDYWVLFDAPRRLRVATYNTRSMKLWV